MLATRALLIAPVLLLFGCQTPAPSATTKMVNYTCDDGRTVQATYPDASTAVITFDGKSHQLRTTVTGSGARYVGDQWQWWTKGMHDAQLAPLQPTETIASTSGTVCHAP